VDTDVVSAEDAAEVSVTEPEAEGRIVFDNPYAEIRITIENLKWYEAVLTGELRTIREELDKAREALSELLALAGGGLT
jgi:hypothetical protein